MFDSVIVLCTGNICRSPMAWGLLRQAVQLCGRGPRVGSAGLAAQVGAPPDPVAVALLAGRGVDISIHRARQATAEMLRGYDLILAMERTQQEFVAKTWPALRGRVFRWGHWQDFDVPDPYARGEQAFRESLALIDRALPDWTERLGIKAA